MADDEITPEPAPAASPPEAEVISPELAELLNDPKFLEQLGNLGDKVQIQTMRQYIVHQHYAFIYLFDETQVDKIPGKWLRDHHLELPYPIVGNKTACLVKQYEYCYALTFGETSFAEYGNNARMLATLDKVLTEIIKPLNYKSLGCFACDAQFEAATLVKAHQHGLNVSQQSFTQQASSVYKRIYEVADDSQKKVIELRLQAGA